MSTLTRDHRLDVLKATRLLDSSSEVAFDRLTRLASQLLDTPVALVTLVDEKRQFFKSAFGLADPWATRRETPLSHSFCQYVTRERGVLSVEDARQHPVLKDNGAIRDLHVIAYLGTPLLVNDEAIGSFCVIDDKPRVWNERETQLLKDLGDSVVAEIELRLALRTSYEQRALNEALLDSLGEGVLALSPDRVFTVVNKAAQRMLDPTMQLGATQTPGWSEKHRSRLADGTALRPEDAPLARALRGEITEGLEFSLQRPGTTEPIWVEASGRPVRDAEGSLIGAVSVFRDKTEKRRQENLYTTLAGNIPKSAVFLIDRELRCLALDGPLTRSPTGEIMADWRGRTMREIAGYAEHDPAFDAIEAAYRKALAGEAATVDFALKGYVLALRCAPVHDVTGRVTSAIVLGLDVTEARRLAASLRQREQMYRAMLQHVPNAAIMMVDHELRYTAAEGPALPIVLENAKLDTLAGRLVAEVATDATRDRLLAVYRSALAGERHHFEVHRGNLFYDLDIVPIFEGDEVSQALVFLHDVTTRKAELAELEAARTTLEQQAKELREASLTDELTGLLNRRGFHLLAEQEMRVATRNQHKMVLFFADLNGMKTINDTLGHKVGDQALVETAGLLRRVFRSSDVVARLGGDEFVVLATDAVETSGPVFATRLREMLAELNAAGGPFTLSVSVGTSVFDPAVPRSLEVMLAEADAGMYANKKGAKMRRPSGSNRIKLA